VKENEMKKEKMMKIKKNKKERNKDENKIKKPKKFTALPQSFTLFELINFNR
jgi:hypothetical protein